VLITILSIYTLPLFAQVWNPSGFALNVNAKVGAYTATIPLAQFQVGEGIARVSLGNTYNTTLWGTGYIGFNLLRNPTATNVALPWSLAGDGSNNGGAMIYGAVNGVMNFATFASTVGGANYDVSDAAVKSAI
jgi:hypothetical protein